MSRIIRPFCFAIFCIGLSLPAAAARAADSYAGDDELPASRQSRVQLVAATEYAPPDANGNGAGASQSQRSAQGNSNAGTTKNSATQQTPRKPAKPTDSHPAPGTFVPRQSTANHDDHVQQSAHYTIGVVAPGEAVLKPDGPPAVPSEVGPMESSGDCNSDNCCESGCRDCCHGGWCAGADYLFLRPHFSSDLAFHETTATTVLSTNLATNSVQSTQNVNFPSNYDSDFRVYAAYRTACGDEFRFSYWHIQSDAAASGEASGNFAGGAGVEVQAPGTTALAVAGESLNTETHLLLNMYDLDNVQHLGGINSCNCCPAWDFSWSYGARLIDYHQSLNTQTTLPETLDGDTRFTGAGPRVGFEIRWQIANSRLSAYFSGNAALLMGSVRTNVTDTVPGFLENTINQANSSNFRVIPNFELAGGISWSPSCCTTVTAGWMMETFSDLGGAPSDVACVGCGTFSTSLNSGNITSFEGLFVRMEHCF